MSNENQDLHKNTEAKEININSDSLEIKNNITDKNRFEIFRLKRKNRCWVFVILFSLNIFYNLDNGTVPALVDEIAEELKISKDMIGLFGSLQYGGNLLGSLLLLPIINKWNRKYILAICNFLNAFTIITFIYVKNVYFSSFNRVLAGVVQAFIAIFFPLWVDQFGSSSSKTVLMALVQVSSPLGVVLGYVFTYIIRQNFNWKWSFIIQTIAMCLTTVLSLFIPNVYFSSNLSAYRKNIDKKNEGNIPKNIIEKNEEKSNLSEINEKQIEIEIDLKVDKEKNENENIEIINSKNNLSKIEDINENKEKDEFMGDITIFKIEENENAKEPEYKIIWRNIKILSKEKIFIFSSFAISILLFISTVITFWVSDYLKNVLKIEAGTIFILFVVTCVTAPASGIVGGGFIVQKAGGYESRHSILYCLVFAFICSGLSIFSLTPVMDGVIGFGIVLWLFLFFGGALIPNMVGILLDSLKTKVLKGAGNSLNLIINAIIGYLPSPYIYGVIYEKLKDTNPKLPFSLCLLLSWVGVLFIGLASIYRYRKFKEDEEINTEVKNEIIVEISNKFEKNSKLEMKNNLAQFEKVDEIDLQEHFFKTANTKNLKTVFTIDDIPQIQSRFYKTSKDKEYGNNLDRKVYYEMSNIEEVYNDNLPQIIQITDKDFSGQENQKINMNKGEHHFRSLKNKMGKILTVEEEIKKFNTKN